jgi:putative Holliday junction resolvase
MPRILAIDYGGRRSGIAVTDPLKLIATGLCTVETPKLVGFLKEYISREQVELLLVGMPLNLDDSPTDATPLVRKFIEAVKKHLPDLPVQEVDERYTSKLASRAMVDMGMKKKQRQNKAMIDEIAATIMLQDYLQHHL